MQIPTRNRPDTQWYVGVRCGKCRAPILFALEANHGAQYLNVAKLFLTCSDIRCKHQADYTAADVSRFQKAATPGSL